MQAFIDTLFKLSTIQFLISLVAVVLFAALAEIVAAPLVLTLVVVSGYSLLGSGFVMLFSGSHNAMQN